jgi:hypothetical protein
MPERIIVQSPPSWTPNKVNCDPDLVTPVAGQRPGRITFVIVNQDAASGGQDVLILSAANQSQDQGFTLVPGASIFVDTEGEFYAYSVNGTVLSTIETYGPPQRSDQGPLPSIREALTHR